MTALGEAALASRGTMPPVPVLPVLVGGLVVVPPVLPVLVEDLVTVKEKVFAAPAVPVAPFFE